MTPLGHLLKMFCHLHQSTPTAPQSTPPHPNPSTLCSSAARYYGRDKLMMLNEYGSVKQRGCLWFVFESLLPVYQIFLQKKLNTQTHCFQCSHSSLCIFNPSNLSASLSFSSSFSYLFFFNFLLTFL